MKNPNSTEYEVLDTALTSVIYLSIIPPRAMKTIREMREQIDGIDEEIVKLLIRRMDISKQIGKSKEKVTDKSREMQVIINVLNASEEKVDPVFLREIYERIITESKRLQLG